MSQAGIINVAGGGGGGSPIQTLTGDTGGPVPPTANNIFVIGGQSSANNSNGILVAGNAGTSTEVFTLTNRITGTATTSDGAGQTQVLTSFALSGTPATYLLEIRIIAYNVTDALSAGYTSTSVIRTTGLAASEIGANPGIIEEEGAMTGVVVSNFIVGNTVETQVVGLAGKTIDWRALTTYILVT